MGFLIRKLLHRHEIAEFNGMIADLKRDQLVQSMRQFVQHGHTSTYAHCLGVAALSFRIARWLPCRIDERSLLRGSLLHDFYLYDWHHKDANHTLHGFRHADRALKNASVHFRLNRIERDIIRTHMWPLNLTRVPRTRESAIVCLADKLCSLAETFLFVSI